LNFKPGLHEKRFGHDTLVSGLPIFLLRAKIFPDYGTAKFFMGTSKTKKITPKLMNMSVTFSVVEQIL